MAMKQVVGDVSTSEVGALTAAACLFHGFGERSRLAIVQHLLLGEHRVVDLTGHLGLAQSTVSKHLACLLDCGIVEARTQGRAGPPGTRSPTPPRPGRCWPRPRCSSRAPATR